MKIIIDTDNKIIEIEKATSEELIKIANDYPGFTIQSKSTFQFFPTYPVFPQISDPNITPYYGGTINCRGNGSANSCISTTNSKILGDTSGTITKVEGNWSYTADLKK